MYRAKEIAAYGVVDRDRATEIDGCAYAGLVNQVVDEFDVGFDGHGSLSEERTTLPIIGIFSRELTHAKLFAGQSLSRNPALYRDETPHPTPRGG